jgi:hypothetical protein
MNKYRLPTSPLAKAVDAIPTAPAAQEDMSSFVERHRAGKMPRVQKQDEHVAKQREALRGTPDAVRRPA